MLTDASSWVDILLYVALTLIFLGFIAVVRLVIAKMLLVRTRLAFLEITPPAHSDQPAIATENLFTAIHSLGMNRTFTEKLIGLRHSYSVEIVSTKKQGIRFFIVCPEPQADTLQQLIQSYAPDAKIKLAEDHSATRVSRIFSFKQKGHYAYPLKSHEELSSNDPIGYITSAMTKLEDDEQISFQVAFEPRQLRSADSLRHKILRNESFMPGAKSKAGVISSLFSGMGTVLFWIADAFSMAVHIQPSNYGMRSAEKELDYKKQQARGDKPVRTLSYFEHELVESVSSKLKRPLFRSSIRVVVFGSTKGRVKAHKKAFASALGLYEVPKYQSLKLQRRAIDYSKKILQLYAQKRLVKSGVSPDYYSANELAGLFHFPNSVSAKTDNVVKSLSKTLPAPVSLKSGKKLDVLIGENKHHGETTPIGLTESERQRHMYIIGGTGNGKTTLIKYQMMQDITSGKGLAIVDPHGDLAEEVLGLIPEHRMQDVVYINPDDLERPVGVNLLELPEGLSGNELLREKDLVTESTVSVLRKIFSEDDSGGHRIEYVLRNTIQTALTLDKANLFTIFRLLNDKKFRNQTVKNLKDQDLKNFWKQEMGKAGDMQRVKMAAGITSKIGRFLFSASARGMLEQDRSTVDFEKIMDEQKILICNFSKGLLGEDTSALFGITILAKLQIASLKRARQSQADRQPYYLYVDEFQNFATMGFVQMLSEARKYKLFLIMAEQSTQQQQEQRLVDIILANVGTVVAFRSGSPKDEQLIHPLFAPFIEPGELANLPAYNFYTKINAVDVQEPMSGETVVVDEQIDYEVAGAIKHLSRQRYGVERKHPDATKPQETKAPKKKKTIKKTSAPMRKKQRAISI